MPSPAESPAMNQKIFAMGLPVETVSLYLLCCALADQGTAITEANLEQVWTDSLPSLKRSLAELAARQIVEPIPEAPDGGATFRLSPPNRWQA